jgi:hypothetical protein
MDIDKIDWEKIAQALPEISDTRASCAPLTQQDYYFERVFCNVSSRSMAQDLQSLITAQLRRHKAARCEAIAFAASQKGMSFEDYFIAVAKGEI